MTSSFPSSRSLFSEPRTRGGRLIKRLVGGLVFTLRCMCAHWVAYTVVFAIWALAYARVFFDPTPRLPLLFNWTGSVPYVVAIAHYGAHQVLRRGDYVIYAFDGEAQRRYPGLRAQPFFKQISGLPGDRVSVLQRAVFVNDRFMGLAKAKTLDGHPLDPISPTVIPPGHFYVAGTHPDSFDSRYRASGLVRADQIIGKVVPLF